MTREQLQQIRAIVYDAYCEGDTEAEAMLVVIDAALTAPEQEQVGEVVEYIFGKHEGIRFSVFPAGYSLPIGTKLYTHPMPAPAAPEQQPVAWVEVTHSTHKNYTFHGIEYLPIGKHNLYIAPVAAPQRVWQSLTEVEICDCIYKAGKSFAAHQNGIKGQQITFADSPDAHLAWALERVLKEKNHG